MFLIGIRLDEDTYIIAEEHRRGYLCSLAKSSCAKTKTWSSQDVPY